MEVGLEEEPEPGHIDGRLVLEDVGLAAHVLLEELHHQVGEHRRGDPEVLLAPPALEVPQVRRRRVLRVVDALDPGVPARLLLVGRDRAEHGLVVEPRDAQQQKTLVTRQNHPRRDARASVAAPDDEEVDGELRRHASSEDGGVRSLPSRHLDRPHDWGAVFGRSLFAGRFRGLVGHRGRLRAPETARLGQRRSP